MIQEWSRPSTGTGSPVLDVANCKAPVLKCQARGVNRYNAGPRPSMEDMFHGPCSDYDGAAPCCS
jgi:hypothetical protein